MRGRGNVCAWSAMIPNRQNNCRAELYYYLTTHAARYKWWFCLCDCRKISIIDRNRLGVQINVTHHETHTLGELTTALFVNEKQIYYVYIILVGCSWALGV